MQDSSDLKKDTLIRQAGIIATGKIIAMLATFAMPMVLTRFLSKNEYGIYAQFYVITLFCSEFFSLGIQTNLFYFYPNATSQKRKIITLNTLIILVINGLFTIGILNIPFLNKHLIGEGELIEYLPYILVAVFLLTPQRIIEPLYILKKDKITSIIYPPLDVILKTSLVICFVLISPSIESVLKAVILSAFIFYIFLFIYVLRGIELNLSFKKLFNISTAKEQLSYSLPFGVGGSLNSLGRRFDKIISISYLSTTAFASYSIAFFGIPGIQQIYNSLSQVYLIEMTKKFQENKMNEILNIYKSLVTKMYSISIPAIIIVSLYAEKIIRFLFTEKYIDAVPIFRVYLISILFFTIAPDLILRATGKTRAILKSQLISSFLTIPTTFFLVKYIGIWGALSGALFSMILPRIIQLHMEIKALNSSILNFLPWKKFGLITILSSISFLPFLILELTFSYNTITTAVLGILYLLIVSFLEIQYSIFIVEKSFIRRKLSNMIKKLTVNIRNY